MENPNAHGTNDAPPASPQVSPLEILTTIVRGWRTILVLPLVLALIVGIATFLQQRSYAATASFMTGAADNRAAGGAALLAQQFGINLGYERPGETPQFYVDLLRTRSLLRQVVESGYEVREEDGRVRRATLLDLYETRDDPRLPPRWDQAVEVLRRNLSTSVTGTGMVELTVVAAQPEVAEQIADRLLQLLDEFNTGIRQRRAREEGEFVADRVRDAHSELLAVETQLQQFLTQNRVYEHSPELVFQYVRLQRQVAVRQDVYSSLLGALEQNRIDALRDTPVLTVIDQPAESARPQPRGTITRAFLAFMLGLTLAILAAFVAEYVRRTRAAGDTHYRELEGAAREAWHDLRRPLLRVGRRRQRAVAGDS
jgi:uncharacterized protein involved in exopolysaccharide biosynthesis